MNKEPNKEISKEVNKEADVTSMSGCLIKVFSMLLGPVFLIICAVLLAAHRTAFPSTVDIIYGVILMLIIIARLIDRPPQPEAGHSPVVKYSIIIFVAGIALWVVARFVLSQML